MPKQIGNTRLLGSIDGFCFYKREGEYYMRQTADFSKRNWHKKVSEELRSFKLYCAIKKESIHYCKVGVPMEEVFVLLGRTLVKKKLMDKITAKELVTLVGHPSLNYTLRWNMGPIVSDRFVGLRFRSKGGKWLLIRTRAEWELLEDYYEVMQDHDNWLEEFYARRHELNEYWEVLKRPRKSVPKVVKVEYGRFVMAKEKKEIKRKRLDEESSAFKR